MKTVHCEDGILSVREDETEKSHLWHKVPFTDERHRWCCANLGRGTYLATYGDYDRNRWDLRVESADAATYLLLAFNDAPDV